MFLYGERIPLKVLTNRGSIYIQDCLPGDYVYEFNSGKLLEVIDIVDLKTDDVYEIEFQDHRKSYHYLDDFIYLGNYITSIKYFIKDKFNTLNTNDQNLVYGDLIHFPIEFEKKVEVKDPLYPDPYVAGSLLVYGNHKSRYINLPVNLNIPNQLLLKYHLEYGSPIEGSNIGFIHQGDETISDITWEEFFPSQTFYAKTRNLNDQIIPDEYRFASLNSRQQFIRGVCDTGYKISTYRDFAAIPHSDENMLYEVQKILLSMGVVSRIVYNPNYDNKLYHLIILGGYHNYPGLFYEINNIEKMIETRWNEHYEFKVQIKNIKWKCIGFDTNLVLKDPQRIYITDNFLPKISL